jgi:hypothetical protein
LAAVPPRVKFTTSAAAVLPERLKVTRPVWLPSMLAVAFVAAMLSVGVTGTAAPIVMVAAADDPAV